MEGEEEPFATKGGLSRMVERVRVSLQPRFPEGAFLGVEYVLSSNSQLELLSACCQQCAHAYTHALAHHAHAVHDGIASYHGCNEWCRVVHATRTKDEMRWGLGRRSCTEHSLWTYE